VDFFYLIVDLAIKLMGQLETMPIEVLYLIIRVFNGDKNCKRFYDRYGVASSDQAEKVDGLFAVMPV
jgi:hypothetical protein